MYTLVVIRHGQSEWNEKQLFTGWTDVRITEKGKKEAQIGGIRLKEKGFTFDCAYTSYLKRAIHTLNIVLDEMDLDWIPVCKDWRLNERHYGALQGLNKDEMRKKHGAEQVHIWRRSFDIPPPKLTLDDPRCERNDPRYKELSSEQIPLSESLKDTIERMMPFIEHTLLPKVQTGKKIIISAHGNSLRALVKYLENISDEEIPNIEIPTGVPLVYELHEDFSVIKKYYLES